MVGILGREKKQIMTQNMAEGGKRKHAGKVYPELLRSLKSHMLTKQLDVDVADPVRSSFLLPITLHI